MYVLRSPSNAEKKASWLWSGNSTKRAKCRVPIASTASMALLAFKCLIASNSATFNPDLMGRIKLAGDITLLADELMGLAPSPTVRINGRAAKPQAEGRELDDICCTPL